MKFSMYIPSVKSMRQMVSSGCLSLGIAVIATGLPTMAAAQSGATKGQTAVVQGTTLAGTNFDASKLKGKVVMVFYWSAGCGVCLSHMPELRSNLMGWKGKPFELVTVNVDADKANWQAYEQIASKTQTQPLSAVWSGTGVTQKLPVTLVLDTQGKVVARHEGRIAPEAWDEVAEILP
jgi:thiol-disulfide isomerase/thioredoxin